MPQDVLEQQVDVLDKLAPLPNIPDEESEPTGPVPVNPEKPIVRFKELKQLEKRQIARRWCDMGKRSRECFIALTSGKKKPVDYLASRTLEKTIDFGVFAAVIFNTNDYEHLASQIEDIRTEARKYLDQEKIKKSK